MRIVSFAWSRISSTRKTISRRWSDQNPQCDSKNCGHLWACSDRRNLNNTTAPRVCETFFHWANGKFRTLKMSDSKAVETSAMINACPAACTAPCFAYIGGMSRREDPVGRREMLNSISLGLERKKHSFLHSLLALSQQKTGHLRINVFC